MLQPGPGAEHAGHQGLAFLPHAGLSGATWVPVGLAQACPDLHRGLRLFPLPPLHLPQASTPANSLLQLSICFPGDPADTLPDPAPLTSPAYPSSPLPQALYWFFLLLQDLRGGCPAWCNMFLEGWVRSR